MKHKFKITFFCFIFLSLSQSIRAQEGTKGQTIDKIIAKVGGEYILYSELMGAYSYQKQGNPTMDESAFCPILEQMIAQKILVNQAKLDSLEATEPEVEAQLDARIDQILRSMNNDEEFFQQQYGKTVLEVKEDMRESISQNILAEKIQRNLINEVNITPQEVKEFYDRIPQDSLPYLNSEVEISEIILKPEVNDVEAKIAKDKLIDIKNKIESGEETFEDMAKKFSDDLGSGTQGGYLGWSKRGQFVTEFEATAYDLEKDEISEIVETQFGYHILQLLDRRGNQLSLRHILIKPTITQDDLDKTTGKLDSIKNLIMSDSLDFGRAVRLYSNKDAFSYNNNGRMSNPKTGDTFFETVDLPNDIYFAIEELEVGEVTDPIEFLTRGEKEYRIVQLQSKTKPHQASLEQDYSRIQRYAKESKKNEIYNKWVFEKLAETFIEIDDDFGECRKENLGQKKSQ